MVVLIKFKEINSCHFKWNITSNAMDDLKWFNLRLFFAFDNRTFKELFLEISDFLIGKHVNSKNQLNRYELEKNSLISMNPINRLSWNYNTLVFTSSCMFFIVWIILNDLVTQSRYFHLNLVALRELKNLITTVHKCWVSNANVIVGNSFVVISPG